MPPLPLNCSNQKRLTLQRTVSVVGKTALEPTSLPPADSTAELAAKDALIADLQAQLAAAQAQVASTAAELSSTLDELEEAYAELTQAKAEMYAGWEQVGAAPGNSQGGLSASRKGGWVG